MSATKKKSAGSGIDIQYILFILFCHKWKILFFTFVGLGAAAVVYLFQPKTYESVAKLMVRYVVERSSLDEGGASIERPGGRIDQVMNTEVEMLMSRDLSAEVAENLASRGVIPKVDTDGSVSQLTGVILSGLQAKPVFGTKLIKVSLRNDDGEFVAPALKELLIEYRKMHLEIHRSVGAFDFVNEQTNEVKARLNDTEDQLKRLTSEAGIISLPQRREGLEAALMNTWEELVAAETELSEQEARVAELEKLISTKRASDNGNSPSPADGEVLRTYRALSASLDRLHQQEMDLRSRYRPDSAFVKINSRQIAQAEKQRREMEENYPMLIGAETTQIDLPTAKSRLAEIKAKKNALERKLDQFRETGRHITEVGSKIEELERQKKVDEENYKYFEASLQKARIDEALDPSKIPNISIVESPTPPNKVVVNDDMTKVMLGLGAGGLAIGLGIAFLMEMLLDRTVKRPLEIELYKIPLLQTIPYLLQRHSSPSPRLLGDGGGGNQRKKDTKANYRAEIAPWHPVHFIRSFAESIRDRLILSFELENLTHKPKLVGVSGVSGGEGVTTLAVSLAAALSETGDGKVLFIDMSSDGSGVHPFFEGKPAPGLSEALSANGNALPARDNLYLAKGIKMEDSGPKRLAPKQLYALMPNLRASEFDYIIFDLPPVARNSATLAFSRCLDKFLLVAEAEKTDRDELKRASKDLVAAQASVVGVLNKNRRFAPEWLGQPA